MLSDLMSTDHLPLSLEQRLRLGMRLLQLRRDRSLTIAQVAHEALGYTRSHAGVSRLERGVLAAVNTLQLESLSRFFKDDLKAFVQANANTHFNAYAEVELGPEVALRTMQLQGVLHFGGQAQDRVKRFESILPEERLQAWLTGSESPDLDTLDKISKQFDLTRSWLPAGR